MVGARIRAARRARDLSQEALAHAVWRVTSDRLTPAATDISRYERGKHAPRAEMIAAIATATGHDLEFFLNDSEEAEPDEEAALRRLARDSMDIGRYDMAGDLLKLAALAAGRKTETTA